MAYPQDIRPAAAVKTYTAHYAKPDHSLTGWTRFAEAQANYDAAKHSVTTGKRLDKCVGAGRKGLHPYPTYEAHYADGTVRRMSFWTKHGKRHDFAAGRRLCANGTPIVDGYVFHGDRSTEVPFTLARDPSFDGPAFYEFATVSIERAKRVTATHVKQILAKVLDGDQAAVAEARELLAA